MCVCVCVFACVRVCVFCFLDSSPVQGGPWEGLLTVCVFACGVVIACGVCELVSSCLECTRMLLRQCFVFPSSSDFTPIKILLHDAAV